MSVQHTHTHHCCIHSATEKLENLPQILITDINWLFLVSFWFPGWKNFPVLPGEVWEQIPEVVTTVKLLVRRNLFISCIPYISWSRQRLQRWAAASSLQTAQVKHKMFLLRSTWTLKSSGRFWEYPKGAGTSPLLPLFVQEGETIEGDLNNSSESQLQIIQF